MLTESRSKFKKAARKKVMSSVEFIVNRVTSVLNFFRSSYLSLLLLLVVFLLLLKMEQAYTMLVVMLESQPFSLLLTLLAVNALAIMISHYPIYVYYSKDLNNSQDYTEWHVKYPFKWWLLRKLPVFVFTTREDHNKYRKDIFVNTLRYALGIVIYYVWILFIFCTFRPKLLYADFPVNASFYIMIISFLVLILAYGILKFKLEKLPAGEEQLITRMAYVYFFTAMTSITLLTVLLVSTLASGIFGFAGFWLLIITGYLMMINYVLFRLLRTRFRRLSILVDSWARWLFRWLSTLERSENYVKIFVYIWIFSTFFVLYSNTASLFGLPLANGLPILLMYFYFYYFVIANTIKYFLAVPKVKEKNPKYNLTRYKVVVSIISLAVVAILVTVIFNLEQKVHELEFEANKDTGLTEQEFLKALETKPDTLFFIASHGGGLKANIWTQLVLNELQRTTDGRLFNRTAALSGASGGSLGLALYTGLYKNFGNDTHSIGLKIEDLARQDYASLDLVLTLGLDSYRKLFPLNYINTFEDRPYYSMLKYQNIIESEKSKVLSTTTFREYWNDAYSTVGYCPSLIMNTAGTNGKRGILWSIIPVNFDRIFHFADDLENLSGGCTLSYFQAISTTNRFPVFSPAAKIKGYGHYMDAGAIDNSGLLGCLDLYNHWTMNRQLTDKQFVYVEIVNGKSLYIEKVVQDFMLREQINHIPLDEKENDNIVVNIQTGLNLDKIPGYLSDFLKNRAEADPNIHYVKIIMPRKLTLSEVEGYLDGKILNCATREKLRVFIDQKNRQIDQTLNNLKNGGKSTWAYYEPTLSRHLSASSFHYMRDILQHEDLKNNFRTISKFTQ